MAYILIDEGELLRRRALPQNNPATLLFALEHCESIEEFQELVHTIGKRLRHSRYDELRRSILSWLKTDVWPSRVVGLDIGHIQTLQELDTMLIEERPKFDEVPFRKGREKGRQEGRLEGANAIVQRLLQRKFGTLPPHVEHRLKHATPAQLETWSLNVLDANDLDTVFTD